MLIIASICSMLNRLMYDMLNRYHMLCWGSAFLTRNRARPPPGPGLYTPVHEQVNTH